MHWPTHVNVLPILTYPLCRIGFWIGFSFSKCFCFGFDLGLGLGGDNQRARRGCSGRLFAMVRFE